MAKYQFDDLRKITQQIILIIGREQLEKSFESLDKSGLEIKVLHNGVDLDIDIDKVIALFEDCYEQDVKEGAIQILNERLGNIQGAINRLQDCANDLVSQVYNPKQRGENND